MQYRVGIDIGGTFTDFTVLGDDGSVFLWKEDTDSRAPVNAIRAGIDAVANELGETTESFLGKVKLVVHGTTIATNTLIQRNGPPVGLLCTEGFRDILYLRDAYKPERFNVHLPHPKPFVDRYLRLPLRERLDRNGVVKVALDEAQVREAAATFRRHEVGAVAVALLWSVVNPVHEKRVAEILAEEMPGVPVLCSADILPEIREWERTSASALSAYMLPGIREYLGEFEALLRKSGYGRGPLIMQINGGCASVPDILRRPVNVLASGPAAAPAAAAHYVRNASLRNVITIDMGGTSLDACLIRDGRAAISRNIQV
jgi:N-methylhydantoinase A